MIDYNSTKSFQANMLEVLDTGLEKPSPVYLGYDIQCKFAAELADVTALTPIDRCFVITDALVCDLFGQSFLAELQKHVSGAEIVVVPSGEAAKSWEHLRQLCERLLAKKASKRSLVIALGGGAIGNLAGMAAALMFRGIRFVEVPTTMSHMTDGTLSNKQAVNGAGGKNHFGTYHAPIFIWSDTRYLETEPSFVRKAGIVEGIKNALIDQPGLIPYLEKHVNPNCDYTPAALTDLCRKIIVSKLEILKKDPTEKHFGIVLEYGHTFAHAIEWLAHGKILHGAAVSIGMKIAAQLSMRLGYIDQHDVDLHYRLLDDILGLTPPLPDDIDTSSIIETMGVDNKKMGAEARFVLLNKIGSCCEGDSGDYLVKVDRKVVYQTLDGFIERYRNNPRGSRFSNSISVSALESPTRA
ncbi:MAG: 2-deoxy-scyllo-inosose synthase [Polyangiaceae bacterium]